MSESIKELFYFTREERKSVLTLLFILSGLLLAPGFFPDGYRIPEGELKKTACEFSQALPDTVPSVKAEIKLFPFDPNVAEVGELQKLGLSKGTAENIVNYRERVAPFRTKEDLRKIYRLTPEAYSRLAPYVEIGQPPKAEEKGPEVELVPFDPNTAGEQQLLGLGLEEQVVSNLLKYRRAGGRFRRAADLKKIYGLKEEDFIRLQAFIRIEQAHQHRKIDINTADSSHWKGLYGIGPVLAGRIVRFREALGGFADIEQVAQTYGLPDSTFSRIRSQLVSKTGNLEKIELNRAAEASLASHPYLNYRQARAIVRYREEHGFFTDVEALAATGVISPEDLQKLKPYLSFDKEEQ